MNDFAIVGSTALSEEEFYRRSALGSSIRKLSELPEKFEHRIFFENRTGLPAVYNKAMTDCRTKKKKYVIFVHDDVYLNDLFMFDKLRDGFNRFDLIGVAGSQVLDLFSDKVGWCECDPAYRAGGVVHPVEDRREGVFYHVHYGVTPRRCLVVDGVFMAVNLGVMGSVMFDEQFTFDFYDLDFCLAVHASGGRIGVMPVLITHLSIGASFGSERYKSMQANFVAKHMPSKDGDNRMGSFLDSARSILFGEEERGKGKRGFLGPVE